MGYMSGHILKMGGDYVLSLLKDDPTLTYDRFYDATHATRQKLCQGVGMTEDEADFYCIEGVIDVAIAHMERIGLVKTAVLNNLLADGEPNYQIELTQFGIEVVKLGIPLEFPGYDL